LCTIVTIDIIAFVHHVIFFLAFVIVIVRDE
jgi:hypothetical protein